jgi:hypothetical protein
VIHGAPVDDRRGDGRFRSTKAIASSTWGVGGWSAEPWTRGCPPPWHPMPCVGRRTGHCDRRCVRPGGRCQNRHHCLGQPLQHRPHSTIGYVPPVEWGLHDRLDQQPAQPCVRLAGGKASPLGGAVRYRCPHVRKAGDGRGRRAGVRNRGGSRPRGDSGLHHPGRRTDVLHRKRTGCSRDQCLPDRPLRHLRGPGGAQHRRGGQDRDEGGLLGLVGAHCPGTDRRGGDGPGVRFLEVAGHP